MASGRLDDLAILVGLALVGPARVDDITVLVGLALVGPARVDDLAVLVGYTVEPAPWAVAVSSTGWGITGGYTPIVASDGWVISSGGWTP